MDMRNSLGINIKSITMDTTNDFFNNQPIADMTNEELVNALKEKAQEDKDRQEQSYLDLMAPKAKKATKRKAPKGWIFGRLN